MFFLTGFEQFSSFYSKRTTPAHHVFNVPLPVDGNISDLEDDNETDDENVALEDLESETEEEIIESDSGSEDADHGEESYDSNEIQDVPTSSKANQTTKMVQTRNRKKAHFSWTQNKWIQPNENVIEEKSLRLNNSTFSANSAPYEFLKLFCTEEYFQLVAHETNIYNIQRSTVGLYFAVNPGNKKRRTSFKKLSPVSIDEVKNFFGIMLYMGVHKLPNRRMYWGTSTNVPVISETMTRNRFDEILSIPHFNDNNLASPSTSPDHNKLHKIQPVIEFFNARFNEVVFPETNEAVDEMMIPSKGKHSVKMYIPKKSVKWGYKLWCRAGISGYVYELEVFGGKGTKGTPENIQSQYVFGESENIVLRLFNNL